MSQKISDLVAGGAFTGSSAWETNSSGAAPSVRRTADQLVTYTSGALLPAKFQFVNNGQRIITSADGEQTVFLGSGAGSLVIPANTLQVGTTFVIDGVLNTLDPGPNAPQFDLKAGFASAPDIAVLSHVATSYWFPFRISYTVQSITSPTQYVVYISAWDGYFSGGTSVGNAAAVTINPTVAQTFQVTGAIADFGAGEAIHVEQLNITRFL